MQVGFDTAVRAKEKGFNEPTEGHYSANGNEIKGLGRRRNSEWEKNVSAPTQSELQAWLRDVHKLSVEVQDWNGEEWVWGIRNIKEGLSDRGVSSSGDIKFTTYEQALEIGLQETLKLI